jgi:serine/threonine protein kinase
MSSDHGDRRSAAGNNPTELPDDPRLMQAVQEFLDQLEAGQCPDRQAFLDRFPDLAAPLAQCLEGLELVHRGAGRKRHTLSAGGERPRGDGTGDSLPTEPLGDFQILSEIGRGGMGIVYEALQLSLGRRVALKVLPFAATFDAKHLQRFHNEAQAAARLHHTNIVPVYAVGRERGVNFYAMQLIEGQSLAVTIRQMRAQAGRAAFEDELATQAPRIPGKEQITASFVPSASTTQKTSHPETITPFSAALQTQRSGKHRDFFRTAARLAAQAADALEHAHQFGIVHRDIKPANLLVDENGQLWVTDFGLAQFHADVSLTQTGDILGTLRYMSPEQANGQRVLLDHRTDVYSLGATLYELVTLEPIFPGRNRQQLLHQIIHDEPRAPRSLEKSVPVELETIILKAVSKSPADRYATAQEMAADLRRYLEDKPILAKRPSLLERARKWRRRHPSAVVAGILLLFVCIAGLLVNNWLIAKEQEKTQAALNSEKQRAAEARRAVDLLVDVSEEELADQPHLQAVRQRLLETALAFYQDFIDSGGGDATAQAELENGRKRVRSILEELATLQGARLLGLATEKAVQKDMDLSESQRTQLAALNEGFAQQRMKDFREQRWLDPEVRRQKFYEVAKTQEAALRDILEAAQLRRLRQIELQLLGARAFQESPAVDTLKLSVEQKRQIRKIRGDAMARAFTSRPDRPGPGGFGKRSSHGQHFKRLQQIQKAEMESILALLSTEQRNRWQELVGAPFEGPIRMPWGYGPPPHDFGPPRHKHEKKS